MEISTFAFDDVRMPINIEQSFAKSISYEFSNRRVANHRYSLRAFASFLNVDHSLLSKVIRGKSRLAISTMLEIGTRLDLQEPWFLKLREDIGAKSHGDAGFRKRIAELNLRERKVRNHLRLEQDKSDFIANWYDSVILEMTTLRNWEANAEWISERLGGTVTPTECAQSLERLRRLDLVQVNEQDAVMRANCETLLLSTEAPKEKIRKFHREVLNRAISAIDQLSLEDRQLIACTVPLKFEDVPRAHDAIAEAVRKITSYATSENADEIFQISNQMVRVTFEPNTTKSDSLSTHS